MYKIEDIISLAALSDFNVALTWTYKTNYL